MINWLVKAKGLTRQQAYVVASVVCDLRIGNVVDLPNYTVSTICPLEIFDTDQQMVIAFEQHAQLCALVPVEFAVARMQRARLLRSQPACCWAIPLHTI